MKHLIYLFMFLFTFTGVSFAQDEEDGGGKLRDKMVEYIQDKLSLSKAEAEKFQPIFLDYLKQLKSARNDAKGDRVLLQQKIADIRLKTRDQLKPILGEKRSNDVFVHEKDFIEKVREEINSRREGRTNKRTRALLQ